MGFTEYEKGRESRGDAFLRVYPNKGGGYVSQAALDEYFRNGPGYRRAITFLTDVEISTLAIAKKDGANAYTLSARDDGGAMISIRNVLINAFDVDPDDLEKGFTIPLERDDETGCILGDLTELVEKLTDDVHCDECGKRCNEQGLKNHINRKHLTGGMPDDEASAPEGDDSWKEMYDKGQHAAQEASGE